MTNINTGFKLNSITPIDKRLSSDTLEWITSDNVQMPDVYFTASHQIDTASGTWTKDATLYLYDKNGPSDSDIPDTHCTRLIKSSAPSIWTFLSEQADVTRSQLLNLFNANPVSNCDIISTGSGLFDPIGDDIVWNKYTDKPEFLNIILNNAYAVLNEENDRWSLPLVVSLNEPNYVSKDDANSLFATVWPERKPGSGLSAAGMRLIPYYNYSEDDDGYKCIMINTNAIPEGYNSYEELCRANCPDNSYETENTRRGPWRFSFDPGNNA